MKRTLLAAIVFAMSLGILAPPAGAASTTVTYAIATATATPICSPPSDVLCIAVSGYTFTGPGTQPQIPPGPPSFGDFTLTFHATRFFPPNPCRMKTGTGTMDVTWDDATTTTATFTFKSRDGKILSIQGQVTGGTSLAFPPNPWKGFATFPPNPCVGGTATASITLTPAS